MLQTGVRSEIIFTRPWNTVGGKFLFVSKEKQVPWLLLHVFEILWTDIPYIKRYSAIMELIQF